MFVIVTASKWSETYRWQGSKIRTITAGPSDLFAWRIVGPTMSEASPTYFFLETFLYQTYRPFIKKSSWVRVTPSSPEDRVIAPLAECASCAMYLCLFTLYHDKLFRIKFQVLFSSLKILQCTYIINTLTGC